MYRECPAKLTMAKMFLKDGLFDESTYTCKVVRYIPEKESIYLLTGKTELPTFSLDAIYDCSIHEEDEVIKCQGVITERYSNKHGRIIVFRIKNGFYKNTINRI